MGVVSRNILVSSLFPKKGELIFGWETVEFPQTQQILNLKGSGWPQDHRIWPIAS